MNAEGHACALGQPVANPEEALLHLAVALPQDVGHPRSSGLFLQRLSKRQADLPPLVVVQACSQDLKGARFSGAMVGSEANYETICSTIWKHLQVAVHQPKPSLRPSTWVKADPIADLVCHGACIIWCGMRVALYLKVCPRILVDRKHLEAFDNIHPRSRLKS